MKFFKILLVFVLLVVLSGCNLFKDKNAEVNSNELTESNGKNIEDLKKAMDDRNELAEGVAKMEADIIASARELGSIAECKKIETEEVKGNCEMQILFDEAVKSGDISKCGKLDELPAQLCKKYFNDSDTASEAIKE